MEEQEKNQKPEQKLIDIEDTQGRIDAYRIIIEQARHEIDILDLDLDKRIFDCHEIYSGIKNTILESSHAKVRILVHSAHNIIKDGRHLVYLMEKLSSYIELRELHPDDQQFSKENLIIADKSAFCRTRNEQPFEGRAELHNVTSAEELNIFFDRLWENATRPTDLLRLHL